MGAARSSAGRVAHLCQKGGLDVRVLPPRRVTHVAMHPRERLHALVRLRTARPPAARQRGPPREGRAGCPCAGARSRLLVETRGVA